VKTGVNLSRMDFPAARAAENAKLWRKVWRLVDVCIQPFIDSGLVTYTASFGLAVANPAYEKDFSEVWDDPLSLVGYTIQWGPDGRQYAMNAIRMLRPAAREGADTLVLLEEKDSGVFRDVVPLSVKDKNPFPWGDLRLPGAAYADCMDGGSPLVAVDGLGENVNHLVAKFIANFLQMCT